MTSLTSNHENSHNLDIVLIPINKNSTQHLFDAGQTPDADSTHLRVLAPWQGALRAVAEDIAIDADLTHATIAAVAMAKREAQDRDLRFVLLPWMIDALRGDSRIAETLVS